MENYTNEKEVQDLMNQAMVREGFSLCQWIAEETNVAYKKGLNENLKKFNEIVDEASRKGYQMGYSVAKNDIMEEIGELVKNSRKP